MTATIAPANARRGSNSGSRLRRRRRRWPPSPPTRRRPRPRVDRGFGQGICERLLIRSAGDGQHRSREESQDQSRRADLPDDGRLQRRQGAVSDTDVREHVANDRVVPMDVGRTPTHRPRRRRAPRPSRRRRAPPGAGSADWRSSYLVQRALSFKTLVTPSVRSVHQDAEAWTPPRSDVVVEPHHVVVDDRTYLRESRSLRNDAARHPTTDGVGEKDQLRIGAHDVLGAQLGVARVGDVFLASAMLTTPRDLSSAPTNVLLVSE